MIDDNKKDNDPDEDVFIEFELEDSLDEDVDVDDTGRNEPVSPDKDGGSHAGPSETAGPDVVEPYTQSPIGESLAEFSDVDDRTAPQETGQGRVDEIDWDDVEEFSEADFRAAQKRAKGGFLSGRGAPLAVAAATVLLLGAGGYYAMGDGLVNRTDDRHLQYGEMSSSKLKQADMADGSVQMAIHDSEQAVADIYRDIEGQMTETGQIAGEALDPLPPQPSATLNEAPVFAAKLQEQGESVPLPQNPGPLPVEQGSATPVEDFGGSRDMNNREDVAAALELGGESFELAQAAPRDMPQEVPAAQMPDEPLAGPSGAAERQPDVAAENKEEFVPLLTGDESDVSPAAVNDNNSASQTQQTSETAVMQPPDAGQQDTNAMSLEDFKSSDDTTFFDSEELAPLPSPPEEDVGIRNVDPRNEPGSKFIVVEKNAGKNDIDSLVTVANRALKLRRYAAALGMFEDLYEQNPRDLRIVMGLAVAQQKNGSVDAAFQTYERVLDLDPENREALVNMLGLLQKEYPGEALSRLAKLRKEHPGHPGITAQMGVAYGQIGQPDKAMRYLSMAANMQPDNPQHIYNMAIIADRQGQTMQAMDLYKQALEIDAMNAGEIIPRDAIYDRLSTLRKR